MPPCLTLSNTRCVSRVKWSNPGKGVTPSSIPRCSSYWKGSLLVTLDHGRQLHLTITVHRLLVLDGNTWNHMNMSKEKKIDKYKKGNQTPRPSSSTNDLLDWLVKNYPNWWLHISWIVYLHYLCTCLINFQYEQGGAQGQF